MARGAEYYAQLLREMLSALREADRLYSARGLIASDVTCGTWINGVRAVIAKADGKAYQADSLPRVEDQL